MNNTAIKRKNITQILAEETGGKSYKAHKYSLDSERSSLEQRSGRQDACVEKAW